MCIIEECPAAQRDVRCAYWPYGLPCRHPKYKVAWELRVGALAFLALIQLARRER